ncbi:MAG: hypothetical protein ACRDIA_02995 [Actinomycetota bacterium]
MNQKFFLDARDYSKFRLLEQLGKAPGVKQVTAIWMMTPLEPSKGHGLKEPKLNPDFPELNKIFEKRGPHRSIAEVKEYFESRSIRFNSYGLEKALSNVSVERARYFEDIPPDWLKSAVIVFDPDNGLQPAKARPDEKHLRYEELEIVLKRSSNDSVVSFIQFPARQIDFYPSVARRLHQRLPFANVRWLKENGVAFFMVANDSERLTQIAKIRPDLQQV